MKKALISCLLELLGTCGLVYVLNPIFKEQGYGLFEWVVFIFSLRLAIPYWYNKTEDLDEIQKKTSSD